MSPAIRSAFSLAVVGVALLARSGAAQTVPLPLSVERLDAAPTGEVNLIVVTDAAGPLASGTLVLEALDKEGGGAAAFASVVAATAYSTAADATAEATLDLASQTIAVGFESASGTLNESFGPLVVVRLALAAGLVEDQRFELRIVPGSVDLRSPADEVVPATVARGRLRLRTPVAGEADLGPTGAEVPPGELAVFGAVTGRPFAIGSGTLEIVYDVAVSAGAPMLAFDPRYGTVEIVAIDESQPGRLLVTFESPAGDLNAGLHGRFVTVAMPTHADAAVGTLSPIDLGPATALFDPAGEPLLWEQEGADFIDFIPAGLVLRIPFEAGDLFDWTENQG